MNMDKSRHNYSGNFELRGMSCASCAARIERTLKKQPGVNDVAVNYAAATAKVYWDSALTDAESLCRAVQDAGYEMLVARDVADSSDDAARLHYLALRRKMAWAIALSLPVVVIGMGFMHWIPGQWISFVLSSIVLFGMGGQFYVSAFRQLRHRSCNMDTLVALSTGIAWAFSASNLFFPQFWLNHGVEPHVYFEAASVIIAFILIGRTLEARAKEGTTSAIRKLMGLRPKSVVRINSDGVGEEVSIEAIVSGDILMVRPGERIPADGSVISGHSFVDESMLSGEPVPVEKDIDSKLYAGTINSNGTLQFRADTVGADTLLSKISIGKMPLSFVFKTSSPKTCRQDCLIFCAGDYNIGCNLIFNMAVCRWLRRAHSWRSGFSYGAYYCMSLRARACYANCNYGRCRTCSH